jgi:hypothetical protein
MGKLADIIDNRLVGKLNNEIVVGIDIGSRGGKAVLLGDGQYFTAIKVDTETGKESLLVEIRRKNRLLTKVRRVLDLRIEHPFYLKTLPTILLLNVGLNAYFGKPDEYEQMLDLLIEELEADVVDPIDLQRVIPLVWAGGTGQEFGILLYGYIGCSFQIGAPTGQLMTRVRAFIEMLS